MNSTATHLDAEELLHLALIATQEDRHEDSIELLKRALELSPDNAQAYYLLGAVHAQIGLYDRAAQEMLKATELAPELYPAHFQLGLLHLTSGRLEEATQAWEALDRLGEDDPFYLFKSGLLHLARDEYEACIADLGKGIELNTTNAALNQDMTKMLDAAQALIEKGQSPATEAPAQKDNKPQGGAHVFLSAYQRDDDESSH